MFDDTFFATVALVCGPPPRFPDIWAAQQRGDFARLTREHAGDIKAEGDWSTNQMIRAVWDGYCEWYERNGR